MYEYDDIGSTYMSLPPNLQNTENECFAYALDRQMQKFGHLAEKLTIWSDLEHADPKYYDHMALCIKAPYYRSEYPESTKLRLLQAALESHRYAGTSKAIEQLIDTIYNEAYFIPWYKYDGEPYCFKIQTDEEMNANNIEQFNEIILKVKAARSYLEGMIFNRSLTQQLYSCGTCVTESRINIGWEEL